MRLPILFRRALLALILNLGLGAPVPLPALAADSAPSTCGPSPAGSPCGGAGPASEGNTSNTNQGAGNPIHVISGNKYQREDDLPALPGVLGLEIVRHYNSSFHSLGYLGYGWRLSYETDLYAIGNTLQIVQADGTRLIFNRHPDHPSLCSTPDPAHGKVSIHHTPRGEEYVWHWTNGRRLAFNPQGRLESIAAPTGEFLTLQRGPQGELLQVTDPQGRSLVFEYAPKASTGFKGIVAIRSPVGRFVYRHDDDPHSPGLSNLLAVTTPARPGEAPITRRYHYGEAAYAPGLPHALTGISLDSQIQGKPTSQRLNTWAYDGAGRAILSVKGEPKRLDQAGKPVPDTGLEQVQLQFLAPALPGKVGRTVLTNSLGATTTYTHTVIADAYRMLEVTGAGCASCGEANVRYAYDKLGRLIETTQLSPEGNPLRTTRTERDGLGRPVRVSTIAYANGKPQPPQLEVRYAYSGEGIQPTLIARPSVIPGREHQFHLRYNAHGQPLSVTETGYSPVLPAAGGGVGGEGGAGQALPLARTTTYTYTYTYTYTRINGRSLLTQTDGPLKNGPQNSPADSDITRYSYTDRGRITRIVAPGNLVTEALAVDDGGRPIRVRTPDDQVSELAYTVTGQLAAMTRQGRTTRLAYNPAGWPVRLTRPDGITLRMVYDAAGHLTHFIDQEGNQVVKGLDTEGNPVSTALYAAGQAHPLRSAFAWFDAYRRLIATQSAGETPATTRYRYDPQGQFAALTDPLGRQTVQRFDALGRPTTLLQAAQGADPAVTTTAYGAAGEAVAVTTPNGSTTRQRFDDFGNRVLTLSPDAGLTLYRHDAAGQLIAKVDETGVVSRYRYDAAGRLEYAGADDKPNLVHYRYQGTRLMSIWEQGESTAYGYDAEGRPVVETTRIQRPRQPPLVFTTRYGYDAFGRVSSKTLPDGQVLHFGYDPHTGRMQRLDVDGQPLLTRVEQAPFGGIKALRYGNGTATRYRYDGSGRLAGITTTRQPQPGWLDQLMLRLGLKAPPREQPLYAQALAYDRAGRLIRISRNGAEEHYRYDELDHLTQARTPLQQTGWTYDRAGNRLTQTDLAARRTEHYTYAPHSNRLLALGDQEIKSEDLPRLLRTSLQTGSVLSAVYAYHPTGVPLAEFGQQSRRIVYNAGKRPIAIYQNEQLIAEYRYNEQGERIAKTVYATSGLIKVGTQAKGSTTYYLYEQHRLSAEADEQGHLTAQYLYLGNAPLAKLEGKQIYTIHSDQLGSPQRVTNEQGAIVWSAGYRAFGEAVVNEDVDRDGKVFTLNLRLPGQYYDQETGLHYNTFRDYDPQTGRYLTSDPIGLAGGVNPYAYVSSNPLGAVDPLGLYEEDVHYYMTYFLALVAGLSENQAWVIAMGDRYIDDNPYTEPYGTLGTNFSARKYYHFTQTGYDPARLPSESAAAYALRRVVNPNNPN